jgi:hypothetical protein
MIKIPDPVLYIFIISSVLGFSLRFFRDGVIKQLSLKPLLSGSGLFLMIFLPFLGLLFLAQQFHVVANTAVPFFAGAAILSYVLAGLGLPSYLRGILLLGASVALTSLTQSDYVSFAAAITGLLTAKLTENLGAGGESNLDDLVPPFIWLTSVSWISTIESTKDIPIKAAVILGIMSVSLLMRFFQGPFVKVGKVDDDRIVLKRTVLSATAGLMVLCVLVKVLNLIQMQSLALLCGAGYFITYLYKDLDGEARYTLQTQQALRMLIFIGFLTLVAMRLYGSFGLLAIAPCAMVAPVSSAALFPGIYCASRVLLQVYLQHFNLNVTGINLTHAYAGAAEYAGFLAGIALLALMKEQIDRRVLLAFTLAASVVTPVLSNFILHSEPTCSLFVSVIVSSFLLAVVGPSLQNAYASRGVENIALVPALMISSGILTSGLLSIGNEATIAVKSSVLSCGVVFVILLSFVMWFFYHKKQRSQTPAASGESA